MERHPVFVTSETNPHDMVVDCCYTYPLRDHTRPTPGGSRRNIDETFHEGEWSLLDYVECGIALRPPS